MTIVQNIRLPLIVLAAIGSALSAGVFFAFSTFVMQALSLQPASSGISTMQSINITVFNPWFIGAFLGPAVVCLLLLLSMFWSWREPGAIYWIIGSLLYLVGSIGVTVFGNIPLNDALAIASPDSVEGARLWTRYLTDWTVWNHIRTVASIVAAALFAFAL